MLPQPGDGAKRYDARMALVTVLNAHLAYGERPLLDGARLAVQSGERLGLIGRNGTGKSSLLKALAGVLSLDDGVIQHSLGSGIVLVEQEPQLPVADTLLSSLEQLPVAAFVDERERWRFAARLTEFLQRLALDGSRSPEACSGGERKRAALAFALALSPQLLLLDEPTNHLDIAGIELLETLLQKVPASIFITHDRAFLDQVATRIVELDRGVLRSFPGNFAAYEARKTEQLAAEELATRRFDKFWAQEEVWIRKGVEARRTRNEGRVQRLQQLRVARAARRERLGQVKITLDTGERSGQLVAEFDNVSKNFGDRPIIESLSLRLMRGDRLGLIGPNGAGKSTLIRLLTGELEADSGKVRRGTQLRIAYFDQLRAQLNPDRSVAETISPGSDWIEIGTERKHVMTYLADFLFSRQRAQAPVSMLSGGERNRLLLARLFAQPANFLILDEPTNDLDIESLELLEHKLQDYAGTLLLVSHDRRFLDNIVTSTLAAEGNGIWREYVGGYTDWLAQRAVGGVDSPVSNNARPATTESTKTRTKLSFKEQRELTTLPEEIEALEKAQTALTARMSEQDYYQQGAAQLRADQARGSELEQQLAEKFARWQALEALSVQFSSRQK
jgi:ABC transport system ATP-binding/permease protein